MIKQFLFILFLTVSLSNICPGQSSISGTKLFQSHFNPSNSEKDSMVIFFQLVEETMNTDQYDSAEYWLSKYGDHLDFKKNDLFNYYFYSRQAEIFYYNNLLQLGAQQAKRALKVAIEMDDAYLKGDAYNLMGLIFLNLEKYDEAIQYLTKGLQLMEGSKKNPDYPFFSEPYHLHGNLGEVFINQNKYDKALVEFANSIKEAKRLKSPRAEALGYINAGESFIALQKLDTAMTCILLGKQISEVNKDFDVTLFAIGSLTEIASVRNNRTEMYAWADSGIQIKNKLLKDNPYYSLLFLKKLKKEFEAKGDYKRTSGMMAEILAIEQNVRKKNNLQIESILQTGLKNENRLLQMEIQEARQQKMQNNIIVFTLLLIIALLIVSGLYFRNTLKQKLALASVHKKISQNLHDDIGATLSSLNIYSSIAETTLDENPKKAREMLNRISEQSNILMENMDDMVWSMKSTEEDALPLELKIKNFGAELLNARNIKCNYLIDNEAFSHFNTYESRKHIILIIKEAINNIAKYSQATEASISVTRVSKNLLLKIQDNGTGFDIGKKNSGNGLKNMKERCEALKGVFKMKSNINAGTLLEASIPIP